MSYLFRNFTGQEHRSPGYKNQFCDAGLVNWKRCKRYMAKEKYGKCPPDLLPNSTLSIEEIGRRYFEI